MGVRVRDTSLAKWWQELIPAWQQLLAEHLGIFRPLDERDRTALYGLTEIDAAGSYITNLDALVMLPNLRSLDISDTPLRSLDGLHVLTHLQELTYNNAISLDMVEICRLESLQLLDISYPAQPVGDCLSLLEGMNSLRELYCMACNLPNVVPFLGMDSLKVLAITLNPIPLQEIRALSELLPECRIMA